MENLRLSDRVIPTISEIEGIPGASQIENLLTPEECKLFLSEISYEEYLNTAEKEGDRPIFPRRITYRSKLECEELASDFFERAKHVLPPSLTFTEEDLEMGGLLVGTWKLHSINPMLSFLKYTPGGVFTKHRDGIYIVHEDIRSMITILIYLNDEYEGGRTVAFSDDETVQFAIEPAPGRAFSMVQRVLHQGSELIAGEKHVVRLDIMYERETAYDPKKIQKNELAAQYLQMAQDFERTRQGMKAVEYYRKAFRLNPALEELL